MGAEGKSDVGRWLVEGGRWERGAQDIREVLWKGREERGCRDGRKKRGKENKIMSWREDEEIIPIKRNGEKGRKS